MKYTLAIRKLQKNLMIQITFKIFLENLYQLIVNLYSCPALPESTE